MNALLRLSKCISISLILLPLSCAQAAGFDSEFYHARYRLNDIYQKRVDNHGDGDEALYGTRNFREVLKGVLFRGGANNQFHRQHPRDNQNPLPADGLANLCAEGFHSALYMYSKNFKTASPLTQCRSVRGDNTLTYKQLTFNQKESEILGLIAQAIHDSSKAPLYVHCWNGWHASGYLSALALRQFCGWTAAAAIDYWNRNTDGINGPGYDGIRQKIQRFAPQPQLALDPATQARICP